MKHLITLLTLACLLAGCADAKKRRQALIEEFKTTEVYAQPEADFLLRKADGSVWLVYYDSSLAQASTQELVFPAVVPADLTEEILTSGKTTK